VAALCLNLSLCYHVFPLPCIMGFDFKVNHHRRIGTACTTSSLLRCFHNVTCYINFFFYHTFMLHVTKLLDITCTLVAATNVPLWSLECIYTTNARSVNEIYFTFSFSLTLYFTSPCLCEQRGDNYKTTFVFVKLCLVWRGHTHSKTPVSQNGVW
jgi:hypothetical protein